MQFFHSFSTLLFISAFIISCTTTPATRAKLTFDFPSEDSLAVKIVHQPVLEQEILAQLNLHSSNYALIQMPLSKPLMLTLMINGHLHKLYLKPGYDLKISKDTTSSFQSILFEGEGAPMNNYINHISNILMSEELFQYDMNFDIKAFTKKYDSVNAVIDNFSTSYLKRFSLSNEDLKLLKRITEIQLLLIKAEYAARAHETFIMDQIIKFQKAEAVSTIEMPDETETIFPEIPFDTTYLENGMFDYKRILFSYLVEKHISTYKYVPAGQRDLQWPRRCYDLIKDGTYPPKIKEYLIAVDLRDWTTYQGKTPVIDSIFDEFKRNYKGSVYIAQLQKYLGANIDLLTGNIAPDFHGKNLEGKPISLTDFRGKVVYVDFWATWCGPCLEEIPYAKKLHRAFEDNEVTFLNVSVDKNPEAWRKMLAEERDWLGTHMILDQREVDSLTKHYKILGYPKYLLIDQAGKIVSADASRPSSKRINQEIASLLRPD